MQNFDITIKDVEELIQKSSIEIYVRNPLCLKVQIGKDLIEIKEAYDKDFLSNKKSKGLILSKPNLELKTKVSNDTYSKFKKLIHKEYEILLKEAVKISKDNFGYKHVSKKLSPPSYSGSTDSFHFKDFQVDFDLKHLVFLNLSKNKYKAIAYPFYKMRGEQEKKLFVHFQKLSKMHETYELELQVCETAEERKALFNKVESKLEVWIDV